MMKSLTLLVVALCLASVQAGKVTQPGHVGPQRHLVCYYDSASFVKEGEFHVSLKPVPAYRAAYVMTERQSDTATVDDD